MPFAGVVDENEAGEMGNDASVAVQKSASFLRRVRDADF
jgi:hypothetical protein